MAETAQRSSTRTRVAGYRGGLARSLVRTLLALTFLPLALMGTAAYLRSRTLLRDQVVGQIGRIDGGSPAHFGASLVLW